MTTSLHSIFSTLEYIDRELAIALQRYHYTLTKYVPDPAYRLERYSFGSSICDKGSALDANGEPFPNTFIHSNGFPFGIIIGGNCDVSDYDLGLSHLIQAPQGVLHQGDYIGLFEFLDAQCRISVPSMPDWTITAGYSSLYCPHDTSTNLFARHLKRKFVDVNTALITQSNRSFVSKLLSVDRIADVIKKDTTDVLYISSMWFQRIDNPEEELIINKINLMRILHKRAWAAMTRLRPASTTISRFFDDQNSPPKKTVKNNMQACVRTFVNLYNIYSGRRPVFVPSIVNKSSDAVEFICREVLIDYRRKDKPFVMFPEYIHKTQNRTGFMPIENINRQMTDANSQAEEFEKIINSICIASTKEERAGGFSILQSYDRLIVSLMVRLPAGDKNKTTYGKSTISFKAVKIANQINLDYVEEDTFFESIKPLFPQPGDSFFRSCIQVRLPD